MCGSNITSHTRNSDSSIGSFSVARALFGWWLCAYARKWRVAKSIQWQKNNIHHVLRLAVKGNRHILRTVTGFCFWSSFCPAHGGQQLCASLVCRSIYKSNKILIRCAERVNATTCSALLCDVRRLLLYCCCLAVALVETPNGKQIRDQ